MSSRATFVARPPGNPRLSNQATNRRCATAGSSPASDLSRFRAAISTACIGSTPESS